MDCNVVETIPNINNTFGPGTANGYSAVVFQEILQRRQEPQKWEACWLAVRIWQLPIERIVKADPLIRSCQSWSSCKNLLKNSTWTMLWSFNTWSKLERWKGCTTGSFMNCVCMCVYVCVCVRNSAMSNSLWPWTVACQAPLLIGFSRQEYWSGLPFPPPGNLPNPRIEPGLLHCRWILYCLGHLKSPMSWPKIKKKKKMSFWSFISFSMQQQWAISQSDCDVKLTVDIIQLVMTRLVVGLRRSSKSLPKAKLEPKKVMVIVWQSAACLIYYSFLNPNETITSEKYAQQIDEMQWNLQHLWPAQVPRNGPVLHRNTWLHII